MSIRAASGRRARRLSLALALLLALPALAHDMWLVPPAGPHPVGIPVEVVVSVGMDFPASSHAIDHERVTIAAAGPDGARAEVGLRTDEPNTRVLASFVPDAPGAWILAASTRPNVLAQEAAAFNDYLLHDGLPHVLAGRMDRGELDHDAVERYRRFVKALVPVGPEPSGAAAAEPLGHELEILLLDDPLAARAGETLRAEVRFRGAPLPRANLCWDLPGNGGDFAGQTWTDADGRAHVPVAGPGLMALRLVHMTRPQHEDYEWESFWASFSFWVRA